MKDFGNIRFSGTFRDYQARVLQNANRHLADRRIHIVAAPGSGKTILGLELIRGLGKPAVVLSPSVIIRQQWGERFEGSFLPEGENADGYVSFDLKTPALITSVTYQALHAAMNRLQLDDRDEETGESENFTGFDLIKTMKEAGVKTVCLDEAHHLRSEWQKALESFLKKLGSDITLIALTATPPYDSKANEWKRYHDLCGDIDEEIFVPDLVAQKTLCPHQDYVIFNYPTQEELQMINERRAKAVAQAQAELKSGIFAQAVQESGILFKWTNFEEEIYARPEEFASLLMAAAVSGVKLSARAQRLVADYSDRKLSSDDLERAMQLIIDRPDLFGRERAEELRGRLESRMMLDRGRVCIENNAAVEKAFISSVGKLDSIAQIARSEMNNLGKNLRMLILTDFIKKDLVSLIGSTEKLTTMGTVPIFEQVRRSCSADIALLSGTLVILPDKILPRIKEMAKSADVGFSSAPIEGVGYSRVNFQGSNKNKVSLITEAFNKGLFQILVGTKALLGEGWDSPCINSLILASFVGSFMLSNQMRGRAIRTVRNDPQKASDIFHLVTLDPTVSDRPAGADWDTVSRRFDCFMAPAYSSRVIESGTDRLDIIKPPFNAQTVPQLNGRMLALAADRERMKKSWEVSYRATPTQKPEVSDTVETEGVPVKLGGGSLTTAILTAVLFGILILIVMAALCVPFWIRLVLVLILAGIGIPVCIMLFKKANGASNPLENFRIASDAVLETLKKVGVITSRDAKSEIFSENGKLFAALKGGTQREKQVYSQALGELLSPIDNPRYVLMGDSNGVNSMAVPSAVGNKKENAEILASLLKNRMQVVYTRSEKGRAALMLCRKNSVMGQAKKVNVKRASI